MLVARISDLSLHVFPCDETLALEIDPKPGAELSRVRQRTPHSRARRFDQYFSFNAISRCVHMQPPGCILGQARCLCNYLVALAAPLPCHIADRLDGCACSRVGLHGMNQQAPQNATVTLTHLQRLESESIPIMRGVISESKKPVMLYSARKDSAVMLDLVRKACFPGYPPFPLLHVHTGC